MNRRSFFQALLGGAIAAHEFDIERLLWVPGQKKIVIPAISPIAARLAELESWHWKTGTSIMTYLRI